MIEPAERENPNLIRRREAEVNYRQLVELGPDAIFAIVDDEIVFANPAALELFAANSFDQLIGRPFAEFLNPESSLRLNQRIESLRQKGELVSGVELQVLRLDTKQVTLDASAALLMWNGANAVQICLRPVNPVYEIRSDESSARFHQLADSMPQIVWMATPDGTIDYHNRKWFEQTGLTEKEANVIGVWKTILHPDDAPVAAKNWERSVRTGEPFQMEYRYKDSKSGGYRWHLGRALPVMDEHNRIVRWFGTCTDIHDQKMTELALQEAKEQLADSAAHLEKLVTERTVELEEIVRSSEALNYSIAHDLRAPLRAMMGFSKALLEDHSSTLDKDGQEYARRIIEGARRMDNLINALLAYGRLNYEELSFDFVDIEVILDGLLNLLGSEVSEAGAKIKFIKPFPTVWADPVILKKVLCELIENALKFRAPERPLEIEIQAEEHEGKVVIWIRDNGIGVPPEHHQRIFRVLESLHGRDKYPGTGIGLAIVRRGIERMGGRIGLKPESENGSCFWIELPKPLV